MEDKERFETYGFRHNSHADAYILRILDRKHGYSRVTIDKAFDKTFGNFIKPTHVSQLGAGYGNPDKEQKRILTFNVPEDGIAYKMIYDGYASENPTKIFSSVEEGKWTRLENPSEELVQRFKQERSRIYNYIDAHNNKQYEGPAPYYR